MSAHPRPEGETPPPPVLRLDTQPGVGPRFPRGLMLAVLALLPAVAGAAILVLPRVWLPTVVRGSGWIEATASRSVRAPHRGRLLEVFVSSGQRVEQGQPLARMDDLELLGERTDLEHQARLLSLEQARSLEERALAMRGIALERDRAQLDLIDARNVLLRQSFAYLNRTVDLDSLLASHVPGSHIGIDAAVNEVLRVQGELDALSLRTDQVSAQARDTLRIAEQRLQLDSRQEALERAVEASVIRAPLDGIVQSVDLDQLPDRWFAEGEAILEIADPGSWQARLLVPPSGIFRVQRGDSVRLTIDPLSELAPEPLRGVVREVGVQATEPEGRGGNFLVLASVEPPKDSILEAALRSGFAVRGDIVTDPASLPALLLGWARRTWGGTR